MTDLLWDHSIGKEKEIFQKDQISAKNDTFRKRSISDHVLQGKLLSSTRKFFKTLANLSSREMLLDVDIPEKNAKSKRNVRNKIWRRRTQFIGHFDIGLVQSKSICENFVP